MRAFLASGLLAAIAFLLAPPALADHPWYENLGYGVCVEDATIPDYWTCAAVWITPEDHDVPACVVVWNSWTGDDDWPEGPGNNVILAGPRTANEVCETYRVM